MKTDKDASKHHEFSTDAPKEFPSEDQLDRSGFSEEIARALINWRNKETLVVSLCGEWGSGKSTLANFIKHHLRKSDPDALIVDYNPWEWSGQEKVFEGFFRQIGTLFGKTDRKKWTRRLLNRWLGLGLTLKSANIVSTTLPGWIPAIIGLVALFGIGARNQLQKDWLTVSAYVLVTLAVVSPLLKIPEAIAKLLKEYQPDETLDDLRDEIAIELKKLDRPIIIFIDDIDRLTDTEIALLFQLIKANIKLPNIVFFLMFQKSVVTTAIGKLVSEDGSKYLRKIVQVEWETPIPFDDQIRPILLNGLNTILSEGNPKIEWDKSRWNILFSDGLWPYFENLRDINRFLSSFKFYFRLQLKENVLEVNPLDLMAIEVLRMFDNPAYTALAKSSDWNEQSAMARVWRGKKVLEETKIHLDTIIEEDVRSTVKKAALTAILKNLFPEVYGYPGTQDDFLKELRLCHSDHFYKYFRGSLDLKNAIASRWRDFLAVAGDREKACIALRSAINEGRLEELLTHLFAARNSVSSVALLPIVTALFDVADEFPKVSFGPGLFDAQVTAFRFIHFRLLNESVAIRTQLIKTAIAETTGFSLVLFFISHEDTVAQTRHPERNHVVLASDAKVLEDMGLSLIRKRAQDGILLKGKHGVAAIFLWQNWASREEVAKWAVAFASIPANALILLNTLMTESSTNDAAPEPLFIASTFEPFIDLVSLKTYVDQVPTSDLNDLEKKHVLLLKTAVDRKNAGLAYEQIHFRDCPVNG